MDLTEVQAVFSAIQLKIAALEATVAAQDNMYTIFAIVIGACFTMFALLMTVLIIYLGFKTERAAAQAATEAAKSELAAARAEIESAVSQAQRACRAAEESLEKIRELEGQAEQGSTLIMERLKATEKSVEIVAAEIPADTDSSDTEGYSARKLLREIRELAARREWESVIEKSIALKALAEDNQMQIKAIKWLLNAYDAIEDRENEIRSYNMIIPLLEQIQDPLEREREVAQNLVNLAITYGEAGDDASQIATNDHVIQRFSHSDQMQTMREVAKAMFNKSVGLFNVDRVEERRVLAKIHSTYRNVDDLELRDLCASALVNIAASYNEDGNSEKAMEYLDMVLADYRYDESEEIRTQICYAMYNRAMSQFVSGDSEGAAKSLRKVVRNFSKNDHASQVETVQRAKAFLRDIKIHKNNT